MYVCVVAAASCLFPSAFAALLGPCELTAARLHLDNKKRNRTRIKLRTRSRESRGIQRVGVRAGPPLVFVSTKFTKLTAYTVRTHGQFLRSIPPIELWASLGPPRHNRVFVRAGFLSLTLGVSLWYTYDKLLIPRLVGPIPRTTRTREAPKKENGKRKKEKGKRKKEVRVFSRRGTHQS